MVSEEILVRRRASGDGSVPEPESGADVLLLIRQAAREIATGLAEPVITIRVHEPTLPPNGVSLGEAFEIHVGQHPDILNLGGVRSDYSILPARQYTTSPVWTDLAKHSQLRQLAGLDRPMRPKRSTWIPDQPEDWIKPGPRVIQVEELEDELKRLIGDQHEALHDFRGSIRGPRRDGCFGEACGRGLG